MSPILETKYVFTITANIGAVTTAGDIGGGVSWQRFIARLVAHGPVSEFVPGSILQTVRTDYTILGSVADDVEIHMA